MLKKYIAAQIGALIAMSSGYSINLQADDLLTLEEVIVTAQKRDQSSQDVPIAITAVSSEDMERIGATELKDVQFSTPNLTIVGSNPVQQSFGIRGIADRGRNPGYDQRLGVYVDGVWVGKGTSSNQSALDVASVEVLRGPQGTLFGKNTVAGAININTKRPSDEFAGSVSVDAGNYDYSNITAAINVPFSDSVKGKLSLNKIDRDGYVDNLFDGGKQDVFNDLNSTAARAQLLWDASDKTEVYFTADHYESDFNNVGEVLIPAASPAAPDPYEVYLDSAYNFEVKGVGGISATIDHSMENGFDFTSITSYRYEEWNYDDIDEDFGPTPFAYSDRWEKAHHTSQEFRLASPAEDKFNYVLGLYYLNQNIQGLGGADLLPPLFNVLWEAEVDIESMAAFVHANYQLTETLQLTAGLRYTEETKDIDYVITDTTPYFTNGAFKGDRKSTDTSPKISLNWFASEDIMVYGGYSKGFKSGGYNADWISTMDALEFDDEKVDAYELGIKTTLLDGRLRINAAVFDSNHTDYQVQSMAPVPGGGSILKITNAGEITSQGFEMDFAFLASEWFRVWGSYGYTDAEFDEFDGCVVNGVVTSCKGNRPQEAPKVNYNFGAEATTPMGEGELFANTQYFWRDEMYSNANNEDAMYNPEYHELSGRIGWRSNSDEWTVSLWGKNLTDEVAQIYNRESFLNAPVSTYNVPRTYGVSVKWNFGS